MEEERHHPTLEIAGLSKPERISDDLLLRRLAAATSIAEAVHLSLGDPEGILPENMAELKGESERAEAEISILLRIADSRGLAPWTNSR